LAARASGTFIPPPTPKIFNYMPIGEKIAFGRALFYGRDAAMKLPGKPCAECHSGENRLKRRDLIQMRDKLNEVIAKEYYRRYGNEGDEVVLKAIFYYMYSRWRLDR